MQYHKPKKGFKIKSKNINSRHSIKEVTGLVGVVRALLFQIAEHSLWILSMIPLEFFSAAPDQIHDFFCYGSWLFTLIAALIEKVSPYFASNP